MNFEQFDMAINALKKQFEHDKKCNDALSVVFPDVGLMIYDNTILVNALIDLLEHDTDDSGWIEYFIWELDFGSKWECGSVTENDNDIRLQTTEDLWNMLNNN